MSWQDRPYAWHDHRPNSPGGLFQGSGMDTWSVTTTLIVINAVVYFLMSSTTLSQQIINFGIMHVPSAVNGEVWRLFTATYMHAGTMHLLLNMLGLYFLGPPLERIWGRRQFFLVYTLGGLFGNVLFVAAVLFGLLERNVVGLGASGSVLTLLGAAAVLFPDAEVLVYFLFPVRIRSFAFLYAIWFVWNIYRQGSNFGGDIVHLGGLIVGVFWGWFGGWSLRGWHRTVIHPESALGKLLARWEREAQAQSHARIMWEQRLAQRERDLAAIDRLLARIATGGVESLTPEERQELAAATQRIRAIDAQLGRGRP